MCNRTLVLYVIHDISIINDVIDIICESYYKIMMRKKNERK